MIRKTLSAVATLALLLGGGAVYAEPVTYVLQTPGVVWGGTSAAARAAVEKVEHVESALADMKTHTVTVTFDDEKTELAAIEAALNDAGFTVKGEKKLD